MPGGDDDDLVEEMMTDREAFPENNHYQTEQHNSKAAKFMALYDDAKSRELRQEQIYAKCIDKECTFKPVLITQKSKLSKSLVKEVKMQVRSKSG